MKKLIIVDMPHLFNKYAFGGVGKLSYMGVDTTLPSYVCKQIHRWAGGHDIVCCFDGDGDVDFVRKLYFSAHSVEYKGRKKIWAKDYVAGVELTRRLLEDGGVCCVGAQGYTSADMVFSVLCGVSGYGSIEIVTGDVDLCSLVCEGVSVFLQSKKMTWAVSKALQRRGYFQVIPENFSQYLCSLTEFKGFAMEYNTLLLHRIFRGDKGVGLKGIKGVTPKRYAEILKLLGGVYNFGVGFRHAIPSSEYRDSVSGMIVDWEYARRNKDRVLQYYGMGVVLMELCNALVSVGLSEYVPEVQMRYGGLCFNNVFSVGAKRRPYVFRGGSLGYDMVALSGVLSKYGISIGG